MKNLSITKFEISDFNNFFSLLSNAQVMKQVIGRAHTLDEAQEIFAATLANNQLHADCGTFAITDNDLSNTFIGFVKLEIETATGTEAEIGYLLLPQFWGKGYGQQVAQYVVDRAKNVPQLTKLTANIDPDNKASRKILINNGFASQKLFTWHGLPAEWLTRSI